MRRRPSWQRSSGPALAPIGAKVLAARASVVHALLAPPVVDQARNHEDRAMDTAAAPFAGMRCARILLLAALAFTPFAVTLAWQIATSWFLCDDAFIAFRYARNLVDGHGLVFNRGERVEGYTDFLWVLELAGLWRLGLRPEVAAPVLSLLWTAGTLALAVADARRRVAPPMRFVAGWIAFGLLACCASFACWSTSGLETRQFTFFAVLAVFLAGDRDPSARRLFAASWVFAAAALTRPEGQLLFGCTLAWRLVHDQRRRAIRPTHLLCFAVPFLLVVTGHYLWRHSYYGEWLPNAYYAKHVRPWHDAGAAWLAAAGIELGAWLWLPLAIVGSAATRRSRPATLPFVLVGLHALYLLRIGGDHFEFRPADFYLPLLAGCAAAGVLHLADGMARLLRPPTATAALTTRLAAAATVPILVYCHAIGAVGLQAGRTLPVTPEDPGGWHRAAARQSALLRLPPGLLPLCDVLEPLRNMLYARSLAVPCSMPRKLSEALRASYAAAERLPAGVFPPDSVAAAVSVGVQPFYLRELTFIDLHGLTDAVVARTPVLVGNDQRRMAHDRVAPRDYLRRRGVNVAAAPIAASADQALRTGDFALQIDDSHWLPLLVADREYALRSLPADRLAARDQVDSQHANRNRLRLGGEVFVGTSLLATFEPGAGGLRWETTGDMAMRPPRVEVWGGVGLQQLTSSADEAGDAGAGTARSSAFVAGPGDVLVFVLGGQRAAGLHARLCRDGEVLATFRPLAPERLLPVVQPLDAWAGEALHLEIRDQGPGWIAIDHLLLAVRRDAADAEASRLWTPAPPLTNVARAALLPSADGLVRSNPTTITVHNPLPWPLHLHVALDAPAEAELLLGAWTTTDGAPCPDAVPPGATAQAPAFLRLGEPLDPRREPLSIQLTCTPLLPPALGPGAPIVLDVPLSCD